jgi:hypothetical protein
MKLKLTFLRWKKAWKKKETKGPTNVSWPDHTSKHETHRSQGIKELLLYSRVSKQCTQQRQSVVLPQRVAE